MYQGRFLGNALLKDSILITKMDLHVALITTTNFTKN